MMIWKIKRPVTWLCCLLCGLLLLQLPVFSASAELDYGRGANDTVLSPSQLFDAVFGEDEAPLTDAERLALDGLSEAYLRYNGGIPDTVIRREYDGTTGTLRVLAEVYSYVAANGKRVEWVPVSVSVNGGEAGAFSADGDVYFCEFSDFWHSEDLTLDVDFLWRTTLEAETVDGLLTLPYEVGRETLALLLDYEAAAEAYAAAEKAYRDYEATKARHDADAEAYRIYREKLADHQRRLSDYNAYLAAKADYDGRLKAYAEYLVKKDAYAKAEKAYYDFEAFRAEHAALYDRYELYLKGLEGALTRLRIMDSMLTYDHSSYQFYSGVMGGTVDTVLQQSYLLETTLFVDKIFVENAEKATVAIRPLLKGYVETYRAKYENELEKYRACFAYYEANYEAIRDNMILLYESIYAIYSNSGVSSAMNTHPDTKPKVHHFQQFLGQLYVLRCALDDQKTADPAWRVSPHINLSLEQLVDEELRVDRDSLASPSGVTLPEEIVKLPEKGFPEPVEKPVKDFVDLVDPSLEGAPAEVKDPGKAPAKVEDPGDPPAEVRPPEGEAPAAPAVSDGARAVAEALRRGELPVRAARGEARELSLVRSVRCVRTIDNRKTVTFYGMNGEPIQASTVEYGGAITAPDMTGISDPSYTYRFLGWIPFGAEEGAPYVSLHSVTEDLSLVPVFQKTERLYCVTWSVNGKTATSYHRYGELPVCPLSTDVESETKEYVFLGWSSPLIPVEGDASYEALFRISPRRFAITWIVGEETVTEQVDYGQTPVCPLSTDRAPDHAVYTFTGWNVLPRAAKEDFTYVASYRETVLGVYPNGEACPVLHTETEVILLLTGETVDFREASAYARREGKSLSFRRGTLTLSYSASEQERLLSRNAALLEWKETAGDTPEAVLGSLRMLNSVGKALDWSEGFKLIDQREPRAGASLMVYLVNGKKLTACSVTRYDSGRSEMKLAAGSTYLIRPEFRLDYSDPSENSNLTALAPSAPVGGMVELDANCTFGYEIVGAELVFADGSTVTVEGRQFLMPDAPVTVRLRVEPIVYHVTFVSDGQVVMETDVFFGDKIPTPADPTKAEDGEFTYVFAGWSPYVLSATGEDRAPVYTATFTRVAKEQISTGGETARDGFLTVTLPLLLGTVVLLALGIFLGVRYRRSISAWLKEKAWPALRRCACAVRNGVRALWQRLRKK